MSSLEDLLTAKANWLDELLYFHGLQAGSVAVIFGIIVLYHFFDLTTIFDLASWDASEIYVLGGPLVGILF